jgi:hypothetical protein
MTNAEVFAQAIGRPVDGIPRAVVDVYIPNRDRNGADVQVAWAVSEVTRYAAAVVGGCTLLPTARGFYRNDAGKLIIEDTAVVRVACPTTRLRALAEALAPVLRSYAAKANQETVLVTVDGAWVTL